MKVILYMAMTVNGLIAKENDETPWSRAVWESYYRIAKRFKAIILGRRTYKIMKEVNEFEKIGNPFTVVVTNRGIKNSQNFAFVKSPKDGINLLKGKGFTEVLLGGGSKLNGSFMKENLVDEIYLDIEPLIFGRGIKLFAEEEFERKLKLIDVNKISANTIQLHYKVIK